MLPLRAFLLFLLPSTPPWSSLRDRASSPNAGRCTGASWSCLARAVVLADRTDSGLEIVVHRFAHLLGSAEPLEVEVVPLVEAVCLAQTSADT